MATENKVLMRQSQEALSGNWGLAIGTFLVYFLIVGGGVSMRGIFAGSGSATFNLIGFVLGGPLALGMATFALALSRRQEARFEQMFSGFRRFGDAFIAYILVCVFTILWLLLLIIPGIIAAISYSQTFFIMSEDNSISPNDAIDKSKKMMDGYKMKYFKLCLRYLGLAILCILTLGIGFLWLAPYVQVTNAKFYDDIKSNP